LKRKFIIGAGARCAVLAALAAACASPACAQSWPVKPVRVIVPFVPGGTADTLGRLTAARLSESLGQTFVVDNRAGAGGVIGAELLARSAPDGYTLGVSGFGPHVVATALMKKPVYDPVRDFTHIALFGGSPSVLAIHPSVPAKDLKSLIALAKKQPKALNYGSAGNGSTGQLVAELLKRAAGFEMAHVPYRGAAAALADLVPGHIQAISTTLITVGPQLRAGRARALALSAAERLPDYAEVPTYRELGFPELVASTWFSLSGPAGLPADVTGRLNAEVRRILQLPEVRERLRPEGMEQNALDAGAFTDFMAAEVKRWQPIVRASGARAE
jgi:tripartite-type tricarboxylate transporter receptor subunit TctC